jgi:rubrerythrin
MAIFTGDELFRIALELERRGEQFYTALGAQTDNQQVAMLCQDLADQERQHAQTFEHLRTTTTRRTESRPLSWDELAFAQMLVEERILPDAKQAQQIVQEHGLPAALQMAIQFEKDSILFFNELLGMVDEADRRAVAHIVEQEKLHAQRLQRLKREMLG